MKNFKKFVQISTDEVYGDVREPSIETDVLKPSSYYSVFKSGATKLEAFKTYELPYLITEVVIIMVMGKHEEKFLRSSLSVIKNKWLSRYTETD